ncbi:energy transducer TonB [Silanimonas sp.]|uniref:energy transducer TonB n=1 Tax=Silanimonas sp. TaxID=1929290 RepID=UPI0022C7681A|nr:energy transducer TonB [Silanimonas sp.]MCZ8166342.1 energy transducer TonB [Silanimonas sp.]
MSAPSIRKPSAALATALALALGLSACSPASEEPAPAAPTAAPAAAPAETVDQAAQAAEAAEATASALANLTDVELREKGNTALREQRLYAPAGDNAMEYYLALRQKSAKPDVSAESALIDLMPYALIASEQAINESDFTEAERLLELMGRTDPEAPSLNRIRDAIAGGRTAAADRERQDAERAERGRVAAEQRAREEATAAATAAAAPAPAPAEPTPAPAEPTPAPAQPAPAPVAAAPAPAPAAPARTGGAPRAISTPQPPYPREAARTRAAGTVTVQYTIGADGRVTNVQVVRARPRGLFDRSVVQTVSGWRFEATGEITTQTRTFDFRM